MTRLLLCLFLSTVSVHLVYSQNHLFIGPYLGNLKEGRFGVSGSDAEISISSRSASSFVELPANGERWSIYSNGNLKFWSGSDKIVFTKDGNVSIGPVLVPPSLGNGRLSISGEMGELSLTRRGTNSFVQDPTNGERWSIYNHNDGNLKFWMGNDKMTFTKEGNLGIGTPNPTEKLAVNGKIICEELQVIVDVPADYVFASDYNLMPLSEVAKYIQHNKHLPNVPSAQELQEKGWNVGEMNNKLLEKVEELTLYVIDLEKQNASLKEQILQVDTLKKEIATIKELLKL